MWLALGILAVVSADPRGWDYTGKLPWSQVGNFSEWHNDTWARDGDNKLVVTSIVIGRDSAKLTFTFNEMIPSNYTSGYMYIFFNLRESACLTMEANWDLKPTPNVDQLPQPPQLSIDYSVPVSNPDDWPYQKNFYSKKLLSSQSIDIDVSKAPNWTGKWRIVIDWSADTWNADYDAGSGSSFTLTFISLSLGKCVAQNEQLITYILVGCFALALVVMLILLYRLWKKMGKLGGRYNVPIAVLWHLFDVSTDILFAWSMYQRDFTLAYSLSVLCTALPLSIHVICVGMVMCKEFKKNKDFQLWWDQHICGAVSVLAWTPLLGSHSMAILGSKLGGLQLLTAPFSEAGVFYIQLTTFITAFLEDIPQIAIQVSTSLAIQEFTDIVILSVTVSILTVLFRLVRAIFDSFHYKGKLVMGLTENAIKNVISGTATLSTTAGIKPLPMDGQPDKDDGTKMGTQCGDWIELEDPSSGRTYYENLRTTETRWEKPAEWTDNVILPTIAVKKAEKRFYERRRFVWSLAAALIFLPLGMVVRFSIDPGILQ